jgi:hydroxymethylbilane synthase
MTNPIRIGTRGSPLARLQTDMVCAALRAEDPDVALEVVIIRTSGDQVQDRPLAEIGGKGLFSKEIEQAMFDGRIDMAVHSMKDMETALPDGLCIGAVLPREDPRDALLADGVQTIAGLPQGAVVGTSSVRRQAQLLHVRPDLEVVMFRGNVQTRLRKLSEGVADATLLALAGLKRLDMGSAGVPIDPAEMLPAAAQGAVGVELRADDTPLRDRLAAIDDGETALCIGVERAMLAALDGTCRTPIGALAERDAASGMVTLRGLVATPDGRDLRRDTRSAPAADAEAMATELGLALKAEIGPDAFA